MTITRQAHILFASTNAGKIREAQAAAAQLCLEVISPEQAISAGYARSTRIPVVEENAATYEGNARLKADAFFEWCGLPSLADDTGLEVEILGRAPGLYSARYAGAGATSAKNRAKLLEVMAGKANRQARFYSCLVLKQAPARYLVAEGAIAGEIACKESGQGGFGYDNVFVVNGFSETLAVLKEREVSVVTHRIAALRALVDKIKASTL